MFQKLTNLMMVRLIMHNKAFNVLGKGAPFVSYDTKYETMYYNQYDSEYYKNHVSKYDNKYDHSYRNKYDG